MDIVEIHKDIWILDEAIQGCKYEMIKLGKIVEFGTKNTTLEFSKKKFNSDLEYLETIS